ncbi:hypothetical protein O3P69_000825 [Scylla paramamosain]|uniref:Uncharacterized protein n=1 Tax=Scylla paramamosain TaxID=85552 RepID=A0AAW0URL0_SCYPA
MRGAALPAIATCAHRHRARDAILGRPQDLNGDGIVPRRLVLCCSKRWSPRDRHPHHHCRTPRTNTTQTQLRRRVDSFLRRGIELRLPFCHKVCHKTAYSEAIF